MTRRTGGFVLAGIAVALLLAGGVSRIASDSPDGLEATARHGCTLDADGQVTGGTCMAQSEREHELSDGPLAGYGLRGVPDGPLGTGLAGVVGVLLTFALGGGLFYLLRRRPAPPDGG
ncbi:MAG TPA: PDGLE domain-containing protein [Micromonosporaceae bacterium]|nr:PDGLE domain-containing protein [Micromonosporaceae bacterium]